MIVEALARGLEVECSVLGDETAEASQPGEIVVTAGESGWYDYEAKYTPGGMELHGAGADLATRSRERVRELAVEAFQLLGCSGMARADFFVDGDEVLVNELNTIPGFTATSVYAKLWDASGLPYPQLLDRLLAAGRGALRARAGVPSLSPLLLQRSAPGCRPCCPRAGC